MKQFRPVIIFSLGLLLASSSLHAAITFTNIFTFNGTNGAVPRVLVQAGNDKFYGITGAGGPGYVSPAIPDYGGIFSITYDGVFSNLCFFEYTNGSHGGYLTPGMDGNFYGTTSDTVFKLNPDGTMANPDLLRALGTFPDPFGMLQDRDGTIYGVMQSGGSLLAGSIYKIDTNGLISTLVTFNGTNGAAPVALFLGSDNNFYGLTQLGGNDLGASPDTGDGTIFRMDRSGNLTNVFLFSETNAQPRWLVQGTDGDLYGVTVSGGANNLGTIFRVTTNGALVWSFSFNGTNGYGAAWITTANDGNFYGTTRFGGIGYDGTKDDSGFGTIFRITPNGSFTSLVQFDGTNDWSGDPGSIIQGTDGNLYGAVGGGPFGEGAIFKLTLPACPATNRLMLTTVANIYDTNTFADGDFPEDGLIQASDGMLYGVTQFGGAFNLGTVFRTTLSGSFTTLVSFNGTNGAYPTAPLLQAADGYFYGKTTSGGPDWNTTNSGYGTIFRMDSNGVVTTLFTFNQTNGSGPGVGGLITGSDGALYGVAAYGGPNFTNANSGDGTIFKITTNGDFTLLASFDGTNGVGPLGIIQASDGNFYGTTHQGGIDDSNGLGTVFQMTPGGQINTLVRFNGTNGEAPFGIIQASDGCLYGTTAEGGPSYTGTFPNIGYGTVFKVTTNGDFTLLASFDGTNGTLLRATLTEVCPGLFYGTTYAGGLYPNGPGGGQYNHGTFFQVTTNGDLTALISFGANSQSPALPLSGVIKASDGNYYGEAQSPAAGTIFSIRPVQPPVLQPLAQNGQLNLSWNAWLGYSYAVMYETNLTGSNWNLLSTITPQTNGMTSFSDSLSSDPQRFYQVVLQLP